MGCGSSRSAECSHAAEVPRVGQPKLCIADVPVTGEPKLTHQDSEPGSASQVDVIKEEFSTEIEQQQVQFHHDEAMELKESEMESPQVSSLTILHFNDVYNIEPRETEPVGGAARFATKLTSYKHLNPMVVFSGDCLNPSISKYMNVHVYDNNR